VQELDVPSSVHVNVAFVGSLEVKVNEPLAVGDVVLFAGPPVIVVSGGVVSPVGTPTVHVLVAGVGSGFEAESVACTEKVWGALLRPV
jgi:hypothetical protein